MIPPALLGAHSVCRWLINTRTIIDLVAISGCQKGLRNASVSTCRATTINHAVSFLEHPWLLDGDAQTPTVVAGGYKHAVSFSDHP